MNPFESPILRQDYSTAIELRNLVVHLYNGTIAPDMGRLMRADKRHRDLALAMLEHYADHGEECQVFMDMARRLVD